MRIIFLSGKNPFGEGPFGGAESSIGLLAKEMASLGHSVTIISSDRPISGNLAGVEGQIKFHYYKKFPKSLSDTASFVTNASVALALRKANSLPIDVIYCSYEPNILSALFDYNWLWQRGSKKPKTMLRMAGEYWSELCVKEPKFVKRFERWFRKFDSVNFISEFLVDRSNVLLHQHAMDVSLKNALVLDIGSNAPLGRSIPYRSHTSSTFRIAMVSRFATYSKRQDLLIKAISMLPNSEQFELTFYGEGPRKQKCTEMVSNLRLTDAISFKEFAPQKDLWKELQSLDLLCHFADHEGLCKTVVEAMAVGTPVLCSNIQPLNDLIEDGVNGFLVENDPGEISKRLTSLSSDFAALSKASEHAIQTTRNIYDPKVNIEFYEKAFEDLI